MVFFFRKQAKTINGSVLQCVDLVYLIQKADFQYFLLYFMDF